jgi:AraC-like DNA-binding protein
VRNNKKKVLGLVGIGVLSATSKALQVLLPSLSLLWSTLSAGIGTIGMVNIKHQKSLGTFDSLQETLHKYIELNTFVNIKKDKLSLILKISSQLLSDHITTINNNRKKLGFDPKILGDISKYSLDLEKINDVKVLLELIGPTGKQLYQWVGFIYEWEDTYTGLTMTGKTRAPHPIRRQMYKVMVFKSRRHYYKTPHRYLIFQNLRNLQKSDFDKLVKSGVKIEGLIYQHLMNLGLLKFKSDGSVDYRKLDHKAIALAINKRFKFRPKELFFSDSALSQAEIRRVLEQRQKGVGLNRDTKSLGSISADYLLPFIVKGVSLGLSISKIFQLLKYVGFKGKISTVRSLIAQSFGSFSNARNKFYFPLLSELHKLGFNRMDIGNIFIDKDILPYLGKINDHFRLGFNVKEIASLTGLDKILSAPENVITNVIFTLYSDYYTASMTFDDLRNEAFKEIIMEQIRLGVKDYTNLRNTLLGFDRPIYGNNIKKRNDYVANFFRKIFNKGIDEVVAEVFPSPERLELHRRAVDLIRENRENTRYSAAQLCIDLGFATLYKISESTLRTQGSSYIQRKIGVSFEDLKFEALAIPTKNYLGMAIELIRANINNLGASRFLYNMGKLVIDLELSQDFGYSETTLKTNANRFLKKHTGYTWQDLINLVMTNRLPE